MDAGFHRASEFVGNPKSFRLHLSNIYQTSFEEVRKESDPYYAQRIELSNANKVLEDQLKRLSDESAVGEKETKVKIDSAFFSNSGEVMANVEEGSDVSVLFNTVFNVKTFSEASASPYVLLVILMFASTFMGLGFLIHKFFEIRKYAPAAAILLLTLLFDALIAYQITSKLHDLKFMAGLADSRWTFGMVWDDVNFYLVIFSGFVVYVIWGVLLHFILQEYKKRNLVRLTVRARNLSIVRPRMVSR